MDYRGYTIVRKYHKWKLDGEKLKNKVRKYYKMWVKLEMISKELNLLHQLHKIKYKIIPNQIN